MVALWNSRTVKHFTTTRLSNHLHRIGYGVTSPLPHRCHWQLSCQVFNWWLLCWYRSFTECIRTNIHGSQFQYCYLHRKSLLKCKVSITSISSLIKLVNAVIHSAPYIHAEWAILGDRISAVNAAFLILSNPTPNVSESNSRLDTEVSESCKRCNMRNISCQLCVIKMFSAGWKADN